MIKDLIMLYEHYIKNNNYKFSKEQVEMMTSLSQDYDNLNNAQLSMGMAYIFNFHYEPNFIKQVLSTYDNPVRAFVLYKLGKSNLRVEDNNAEVLKFTYQKTPTFEKGMSIALFVMGAFLFFLILTFVMENITNLHTIFSLENLTKLVYPIMSFMLTAPLFNSLLTEIYAKNFLKLKNSNQDNKLGKPIKNQ